MKRGNVVKEANAVDASQWYIGATGPIGGSMPGSSRPENEMPRAKGTPKPNSVKLTDSAYDAARMASGFTKESIAEYVNRVIEEVSKTTIENKFAEWKAATEQAVKPS